MEKLMSETLIPGAVYMFGDRPAIFMGNICFDISFGNLPETATAKVPENGRPKYTYWDLEDYESCVSKGIVDKELTKFDCSGNKDDRGGNFLSRLSARSIPLEPTSAEPIKVVFNPDFLDRWEMVDATNRDYYASKGIGEIKLRKAKIK